MIEIISGNKHHLCIRVQPVGQRALAEDNYHIELSDYDRLLAEISIIYA